MLEIAKFNGTQSTFSEDWNFVKNWPKLSLNEKLHKYNEY